MKDKKEFGVTLKNLPISQAMMASAIISGTPGIRGILKRAYEAEKEKVEKEALKGA